MNEFFNGFKTDRTHRSFVVALQSRRLLFVVILICLYSVSLHIIIGVLTTFQLIFLIYVVALRPYQEIKSNIVKILNELIFLFLLSSLNFLNKESDWSLSMIYIYMNIICFNTVIVCLILIGFLIKDIYIWCKNRKQHLRTRIEPIQNREDNNPTIEVMNEPNEIERVNRMQTDLPFRSKLKEREEVKGENKDLPNNDQLFLQDL